MPAFAQDYYTALIALIILTLIVLVQVFIGAGLAFAKGGKTPGAAKTGDHSDIGFRALRCYENGAENLPAFAATILVAILAGASAGLINLLAVIHVGLRILFSAIYYAGIGKPAGGPRSMAYIAGWAVNLIMAGAVLFALI